MVSSSTNALFSLVGWSFIPDFATRYLLQFLHSSSFLPPQPPGSPRYRRHYAYTFAFVVLGYLLYTMVRSASAMPPNFYQILQVPPDVDDNGLKVAFRQFARRNHPDRPEIGQEGAELFMMVRDVFEALKDPVKRFAYDRFGADVLQWKNCKTTREFLHQGLMRASGYHIVTGAVLVFWSSITKSSPVTFWRYLLYASFFMGEISLILSPTFSPSHTSNLSAIFSPPSTSNSTTSILQFLFPYRVTYQHVLFLHQLFMFLSVALTRVAPQLFPSDEIPPQVEAAILERTQGLVAFADRETSIMLHTDLRSTLPSSSKSHSTSSLARPTPVSPMEAESILAELSEEMQQLIIEANIKKEGGPLRSAWESALRRAAALTASPRKVATTKSPRKSRDLARGESLERDEEEWENINDTGHASSPNTQLNGGAGELPSPRPSPTPPPGLHRKGSSFVRARSVSY